MPFLNHTDFAEVLTALDELVNNRQYSDLHADDTAMLSGALDKLVAARDAVASPGLRELAHEIHGTDEVEIDDEGAGTSPADEGIWVQAWVWVPHDKLVEAGLREVATCPRCGNTDNDGSDTCPDCGEEMTDA